MSDIKLFRLHGGKAEEVKGSASNLEKPLQSLIEANLESLFGVRFLATEYSTGKTHGGRIDTLGLDENSSPVILEYKRAQNENVINQGLYYLDWLMDHKAEFWKLCVERHGKDAADRVDWSGPRLICIAADFTKYDEYAVQQINRNIELLRYRKFDEDLLILELVNSVSVQPLSSGTQPKPAVSATAGTDQNWQSWWSSAPQALMDLRDGLEALIGSLGDDVQIHPLKVYIAYKRLRNFASLVPQKKQLLLNLHLDAKTLTIDPTWMRDVTSIHHWGTGNVELTIKSSEDLEKAMPLIRRAYDGG